MEIKELKLMFERYPKFKELVVDIFEQCLDEYEKHEPYLNQHTINYFIDKLSEDFNKNVDHILQIKRLYNIEVSME